MQRYSRIAKYSSGVTDNTKMNFDSILINMIYALYHEQSRGINYGLNT